MGLKKSADLILDICITYYKGLDEESGKHKGNAKHS